MGYLLASLCGTWLVTLIFYILGQFFNLRSIPIIKVVDSFFRFVANNGLIILAIHMWALSWCNYVFKGLSNFNWYSVIVLLWVVLITGLSIPIFNRYLYWMIGKEKSK